MRGLKLPVVVVLAVCEVMAVAYAGHVAGLLIGLIIGAYVLACLGAVYGVVWAMLGRPARVSLRTALILAGLAIAFHLARESESFQVSAGRWRTQASSHSSSSLSSTGEPVSLRDQVGCAVFCDDQDPLCGGIRAGSGCSGVGDFVSVLASANMSCAWLIGKRGDASLTTDIGLLAQNERGSTSGGLTIQADASIDSDGFYSCAQLRRELGHALGRELRRQLDGFRSSH